MIFKFKFFVVAMFLTTFAFGASQNAMAAKNGRATSHMKIVATALIKAQRLGTRSAFRRVIQKYADLPSIALYSLGRYKSKLKRSHRSKYYRGVSAFMGRYFANQSKDYVVAGFSIDPDVTSQGKDAVVTTQVKLDTGAKYTVLWRLSKRGRTFKIVDVKVLGFSLTYLQRGMFSSYLRKKNGNLDALIAALNRHY